MKKLVLAVALSVNLALGEMLSRDTIANIEAICE